MKNYKKSVDDILGSMNFSTDKFNDIYEKINSIHEECIDYTPEYEDFIMKFLKDVDSINSTLNALLKKSVDIETFYNEIKLLKRKREIFLKREGRSYEIPKFDPDPEPDEDWDEVPF